MRSFIDQTLVKLIIKVFANLNFLLTENPVITGKYQTGVLTVRTDPRGRDPYIKDPCLIIPSNDQADEVNKRFIIWLVLDKLDVLMKLCYMRIA